MTRQKKLPGWLLALLVLGAIVFSLLGEGPQDPPAASVESVPVPAVKTPETPPREAEKKTPSKARPSLPAFLPPEAIPVLERIANDGPHPYRQDGSVFQNREKRLPAHPRGYYREYTVETPGSRDRGARRLVTGGHPPVEYFYTDDHYRSFRRFVLDGSPKTP